MTIETLNLETLANNSMYVAISFGRFGNSRKAAVEMLTDAVKSRFSHSKKLLISPELAAITKADTAIKALVDSLCLPAKHEMAGLRMAPNKNVIKISNILKEYKNVTRPQLIADFISVYPAQYAEAQAELKEHFNPNHFPSVEELASEFTFEYAFVNFGVPSNLMNIDPALFEEQQAQNAAQFKDSMNEVAQTLLATFHELVVKLADGLSGQSSSDGKKKNLHVSQIEKLNEFITGFDAMSGFAPDVLKNEVDKLKLVMTGVDIEKIRHSDNLKIDLTEKVGEIAKTLASAAPVKPGRMFRTPVAAEPETAPEV